MTGPRLPVAPTSCPYCGAIIFEASRQTDRAHASPTPRPGDVSACDGCARVGRWQATAFGLHIRALRPDEMWILDDPDVQAAVEIARSTW